MIGDSNGLERWLDARLLRRERAPSAARGGRHPRRRILPLSSRPRTGRRRSSPSSSPVWTGKGSSQDWIIPLVKKLVDEGKSVIVFRNVKGATVGCATYLARSLGLPPAQDTIDALPTGDPSVSSERCGLRSPAASPSTTLTSIATSGSCSRSTSATAETTLRVIVATTTLAMGINTPAEAVIIVELDHPGAPARPYAVAEYKNMVGRAGRLGYSEKGSSYVIAPDPRSEHAVWQHYVLGKLEDIESRLFDANTDPRNLVLRTLAASAQLAQGQGMTADEIVAFIEDSFGAFQQRQALPAWKWDENKLYRRRFRAGAAQADRGPRGRPLLASTARPACRRVRHGRDERHPCRRGRREPCGPT